MKPIAFGNFTPEFVEALAKILKNKKVLEVCAGNGYLSSLLKKESVDIIATSLFSCHDGHDVKMYNDVVNIDGLDAVSQYADADVLLVSWPTTTEDFYHISMLWGCKKPIIYIGEMRNDSLGMLGLAGCASDTFFDAIGHMENIPSYQPRNMMDCAKIIHMNKDAVDLWYN